MLRTRNLRLDVKGHALPFFQDLVVELAQGKLHTLSGKNGVGKSTFFNLLRGDISHNMHAHGTIMIGQKEYDIKEEHHQKKLQKEIALVPQHFDILLSHECTAVENLACASFGSFPFMKPFSKKEVLLPSIIERFGIEYHLPVKLLSGGQRQMIALLMVLQKRPSLLLLDEPTATLDEENAKFFFEFLQHLLQTNNLTALVISHDSTLINTYCTGTQLHLLKDDQQRRVITHRTHEKRKAILACATKVSQGRARLMAKAMYLALP